MKAAPAFLRPTRPSPSAAQRELAFVERWGRIFCAFIVVAWGAGLAAGFTTGLALVTIAGYVAALAGLTRPAIGLIGVGVLCTLDAPSRIFLFTGGLFRFNTFNYMLLVVIFFALPLVWRFRDVHTRILLVLIALLALELLLTPDLEFGLQHVLNAVSIVGLLIYIERGGTLRETWIWLGLACGLAAALGGLAYYLQKAMLPTANANAMAYLPLGGLLPICLAYRFSDAHPRRQLALALLAGCNLIWTFLTGSRGGLTVGVLCALYLLHTTPGFTRRLVVTGTTLIVAVGILAHFTGLQEFAVRRWEALVDPARSLSSRTSGRFDLVLGAWYIFQEHPFGVGTGGFASAWASLGAREGLSGFQAGHKFQAHAGWMKILAENGIPGILLLLAFTLSFAIVGWRHRDRRVWLLGPLTTLVLTFAWMTTEFQSKSLWLLAAATATLLRPRAPAVSERLPSTPARGRLRVGAGP